MMFGMTPFTFAHVAISLVGIGSGLVIAFGFLTAKRLDVWTAIFLATTVATSFTGFFFPFERFLPSYAIGLLSLLILAAAIVARYKFRLAGAWRWVYVASSVSALYFNVFVLIVQLFQKVPPLKELAPTQSEMPFAATQFFVLALFVAIGVSGVIRFRTGAARAVCWWLALIYLAGLGAAPGLAQENRGLPKGFSEKTVKVNGVSLHYRVGGRGPMVVLLHGYTQTGHMWTPIMPALAEAHTVVVPDLRGAGGSHRPAGGYDKKTMAKDVRELVRHLGHDEPVAIVGHDIGLMVAYAYAAQYPRAVSKVILMDAFLPGVGDWKSVWLMRDLWHFHFYGETPLALVKGRERTYFEHFWNDFAADKTKSHPEADRQFYAAAYARDDGMRAGFEYFKNFEQDAQDFAGLAATRLDMPVLVLTGEKASGTGLIEQTKLVAKNVKGVVVKGAGHWLMEEAPQQVIPEIVSFLKAAR